MKRYDESEDLKHSDTEITLGIKSILGIFFALALICGVFFGFGYSLGRGNAPKAPITTQSAQRPAATPAATAPDIKTVVEPASATKPAAGEPAALPSLNVAANATPAGPAQTAPLPQPAAAPVPAQAVPAAYSLPAKTTDPAQPANIMVQIAAVAHRQDADVLVTALQQRGYQASVRTEPGDQLLHVQIGPYATRNQARTMQARLLNDGYNAILK